MSFELVFLDAVDPSLGRLDYASLSQQALMEMVIEGIANKEKICGDVDEPTDIEEWEGVTIEDGQVVEIAWRQFRLRGALHLEWLPSSVRKVLVSCNKLTGTLDCASLPTSLKKLNIGCNAFTGLINMESLPEGMEEISVHCNDLSANPTKGHLSVVGWTSTPVLGEAKNLFKPLVVFLSWRRPY
ncbi:hypothetical protein XU18_1313 [Perkinsela sp. CCAP 1560/4]|nr:hypothetical protein XU18_1313 [Perkinsela sp. CCAP 1560/4]|eukprot:KNH08097.1 hypothetical protein XU18_1313 [Perkinsela sp. CCAP 1560/4]